MAFIPPALRPSPPPRLPLRASRPRVLSCAVSPRGVPDVLARILARKATEVSALHAAVASGAAPDISTALLGAPRSRAFESALRLPRGTLTVIAEIKRRSPSKGVIADIPDVAALGRTYYEGGAAAISVLTDGEGFGGSLDDLRVVVAGQGKFVGEYPGPCPVLRKEFIIDEVQIAEAAACGAAAVLVIIAAVGRERAGELQAAAWAMGLDVLVEAHDAAEVADAVAIGATVIGVNNRDLRTFEVDIGTSLALAAAIPDGVIKVAESGIEETTDAWRLRDAGFSAVLVGESLVRAYAGSSTDGTAYAVGYNQAKGLIAAFKAKGSVKYGPTSTAAFWGKGEGAKEVLGEMAL